MQLICDWSRNNRAASRYNLQFIGRYGQYNHDLNLKFDVHKTNERMLELSRNEDDISTTHLTQNAII